jgi:hypothetical protein
MKLEMGWALKKKNEGFVLSQIAIQVLFLKLGLFCHRRTFCRKIFLKVISKYDLSVFRIPTSLALSLGKLGHEEKVSITWTSRYLFDTR